MTISSGVTAESADRLPQDHLHPEYPLSHYVWKLLRLRWLLWWSSLRRARRWQKIGAAIVALTLLGFFIMVFTGSLILLSFLRSPRLTVLVPNAAAFLESVPVLIFAAAFLGILLTSFGVLLQALYLSGDMDFLLSAPVPIRAVFIAKLLQAIIPNFGLNALFSLPVLYGLGISGKFHFLFYPLVPAVLASMSLAAAGISSLLVMGIARLFSARRVAEVLALIGAIVSIGFSQAGYLMNQIEESAIPNHLTTSGYYLTTWLNTPWLPFHWAGRGLVDIGEGRFLTGILLLTLTFSLTGAIFALSLVIAEQLYYSGWASIQGTARKKRRERPRRTSETPATETPLTRLGKRALPTPIRAVIYKDFLILRRDVRNMSQVVTPLIFGIIYGVMLTRNGGQPPPGRGEAPAIFLQLLEKGLVYGNVGLSLFVGWSLISRLALMGFSQEGKSYWILKTAPVRGEQLLIAKFLIAYLPALALGWAFLLVFTAIQRIDLSVLMFGLAVIALCMAGTAGINLSFGVKGANLSWEDPRYMTRNSIGCLSALATMGFLIISLALFFAPPIIFSFLQLSEPLGQWIGLALGGMASLTCAILPLWLVYKDVDRIGDA